MSTASKKAAKVLQELKTKLDIEYRASRLNNRELEFFCKVVAEFISMDMEKVRGITEEDIKKHRASLEMLRNEQISGFEEFMTAEQIHCIIDFTLECLDAGIVPGAELFLGEPEAQKKEVRRLEDELSKVGHIV